MKPPIDKKIITTSNKICPKCGSKNVVWMGGVRVTGSGQPMREVDRFTFECNECSTDFIYSGKMP